MNPFSGGAGVRWGRAASSDYCPAGMRGLTPHVFKRGPLRLVRTRLFSNRLSAVLIVFLLVFAKKGKCEPLVDSLTTCRTDSRRARSSGRSKRGKCLLLLFCCSSMRTTDDRSPGACLLFSLFALIENGKREIVVAASFSSGFLMSRHAMVPAFLLVPTFTDLNASEPFDLRQHVAVRAAGTRACPCPGKIPRNNDPP
jgi:hypothetical protein